MRRTWFAVVITVFFIGVVLGAPVILSHLMNKPDGKTGAVPVKDQVSKKEEGKPDILKQRVKGSYTRAADWLVKQQGEDGAWKVGKFPSTGYTALATYALAGAPADLRKNYDPAINKAVAMIVGKQNDDGSFSEMFGSNKSYVTSVVLMLLSTQDKGKYQTVIKKAQDFLVGAQAKQGTDKGGSGYGDADFEKGPDGKVLMGPDGKPKMKVKGKADLSNTSFVMEALKASGLPEDSEYYKNALEFMARVQQNSETADPEFIKILAQHGIKMEESGGFIYGPLESKVGERTLPDGTKVLVPYASMTYAGLKSLIYAGLKKDDARVQAAMRWVKKNYTLEANAGFGVDEVKRTHLQGLFYYYMSFAKALDAYCAGEKEAVIETEDGKKHSWARELAEKLISIQTAVDGQAWTNNAERWGESDPVLTTSYVLTTYNTLDKWIK